MNHQKSNRTKTLKENHCSRIKGPLSKWIFSVKVLNWHNVSHWRISCGTACGRTSEYVGSTKTQRKREG